MARQTHPIIVFHLSRIKLEDKLNRGLRCCFCLALEAAAAAAAAAEAGVEPEELPVFLAIFRFSCCLL